MSSTIQRIAVTAGEPAGIGPDLCLALAQRNWPAELVAIGDRDVTAGSATFPAGWIIRGHYQGDGRATLIADLPSGHYTDSSGISITLPGTGNTNGARLLEIT